MLGGPNQNASDTERHVSVSDNHRTPAAEVEVTVRGIRVAAIPDHELAGRDDVRQILARYAQAPVVGRADRPDDAVMVFEELSGGDVPPHLGVEKTHHVGSGQHTLELSRDTFGDQGKVETVRRTRRNDRCGHLHVPRTRLAPLAGVAVGFSIAARSSPSNSIMGKDVRLGRTYQSARRLPGDRGCSRPRNAQNVRVVPIASALVARFERRDFR